jgi:hypothetical protein
VLLFLSQIRQQWQLDGHQSLKELSNLCGAAVIQEKVASLRREGGYPF